MATLPMAAEEDRKEDENEEKDEDEDEDEKEKTEERSPAAIVSRNTCTLVWSACRPCHCLSSLTSEVEPKASGVGELLALCTGCRAIFMAATTPSCSRAQCRSVSTKISSVNQFHCCSTTQASACHDPNVRVAEGVPNAAALLFPADFFLPVGGSFPPVAVLRLLLLLPDRRDRDGGDDEEKDAGGAGEGGADPAGEAAVDGEHDDDHAVDKPRPAGGTGTIAGDGCCCA